MEQPLIDPQATRRTVVSAAESLLRVPHPVLDHGFVTLVDYMGTDADIVEAARVSYSKGTRRVQEDRGLINYLMRHRHTSPFEQVELKFHVKLPIFVARQWVRHRMASLNEVSARYSVLDREFYVPAPDTVKFQSKTNKQGRSSDEVPSDKRQLVIDLLTNGAENSYDEYLRMLDTTDGDNPGEDSIARELARVRLTLGVYTQWYWKIDLHNLFHFLKLRMDAHAQYEIRVYAEIIAKMAQAVAPLAYEAFEEHSLHAMSFSRAEVAALREILAGRENPIENKRLRAEFETKLGMILPQPQKST